MAQQKQLMRATTTFHAPDNVCVREGDLLDVDDALRGLDRMLRRLIGEQISVVCEFTDEVGFGPAALLVEDHHNCHVSTLAVSLT